MKQLLLCFSLQIDCVTKIQLPYVRKLLPRRSRPDPEMISVPHLLVSLFAASVGCCDLEGFFSARRVSVEESASGAGVVLRGATAAEAPAVLGDVYVFGVEVRSVYKGYGAVDAWKFENYRWVPRFLNVKEPSM